MPTNLYGPNDNYDLANSHVLPALLRKAHEAKLRGDAEYVVWGSGTPRREFLHVDDLADACVHLMQAGYDGPLVNIGTGSDVTIRELAETVMKVVGFEGRIVFDASKPDGTPRKLLDVSRLAALGWQARIPLEAGMASALAARLGLAVVLTPGSPARPPCIKSNSSAASNSWPSPASGWWTQRRARPSCCHYSCRTGRCSTCKCQVLRGQTEALVEETGLSAAERAEGWVLACVRTALSDLSLDATDLGDVQVPVARTMPLPHPVAWTAWRRRCCGCACACRPPAASSTCPASPST